MVVTGILYLTEVIRLVCVQSLHLHPLLYPPMPSQLLVTSCLFPISQMVELQHSHRQQILLSTHRLHDYLHHFTLPTMNLRVSKPNWRCLLLQRYPMTKMMSHSPLLGVVFVPNAEKLIARFPSEIALYLRTYNLKSLNVFISYRPHLIVFKKQRLPFYNVARQSTRSRPNIRISYLSKTQSLRC